MSNEREDRRMNEKQERQDDALVEARQIIYDFLQRGTMGRHYGNVMARATVWLEQHQPASAPVGECPDCTNGQQCDSCSRGERAVLASSAPAGVDLRKRALALLHAEYDKPYFAGNYEDAAVDAIEAALTQQPAAVDEDVGNTLRGVKWAIPALNNIARRIRYVCPNVSEEVGRVAATLVTGIIDEGQPQGASHE